MTASILSQLTDNHHVSITFRHNLTGQLTALRTAIEQLTSALTAILKRIPSLSPLHSTAQKLLDSWEALLERFTTRLMEYANVAQSMLVMAIAVKRARVKDQDTIRNELFRLCALLGKGEDGWRRIHMSAVTFFNALNQYQLGLTTAAIEACSVQMSQIRSQIEQESQLLQTSKFATANAVRDIFRVWNEFASLSVDVSTRAEMRKDLPLMHFFSTAETSRIEVTWRSVQSSLRHNYTSLVAQGDLIKSTRRLIGSDDGREVRSARLAAALSEAAGIKVAVTSSGRTSSVSGYARV